MSPEEAMRRMPTSRSRGLSTEPRQDGPAATGTGASARSEQSPTATAAAIPARGLLPGDGNWWWNGRKWVPATTEDGLWRWDGSRWKASIHLDGDRPADLAATLALVAEECYAQAGMILAGRPMEWQHEGGCHQLVEQVQMLATRLRRLQESFDKPPAGRLVLGGRRVTPQYQRQAEDERLALMAGYRTALVRLGQGTSQPSLKEADDLLAAASLLDDRVTMLTKGLTEVDQAERMREDAAVAAEKELAVSKEARLRALQEARRAVEAAESAHSLAIAEARTGLRSALAPGRGELKAGLGLLRLHATLLKVQTGQLPSTGLRAFADTAEALWRRHRELLSDLILLQASEAETFLMALTEGCNTLFLLIIGTTGTAVWACPTGKEDAAKRFAAAVNAYGLEAAGALEEREMKARHAMDRLDTVTRDRSSVKAAEAELSRAEADPILVGGFDNEYQRLEWADTPELIEARRRVLDLARRLVSPPEPLKAAT